MDFRQDALRYSAPPTACAASATATNCCKATPGCCGFPTQGGTIMISGSPTDYNTPMRLEDLPRAGHFPDYDADQIQTIESASVRSTSASVRPGGFCGIARRPPPKKGHKLPLEPVMEGESVARSVGLSPRTAGSDTARGGIYVSVKPIAGDRQSVLVRT
eukprot:Polyplicarium_translucidae@DN2101_c0_g2_i1.p1